MSLNPTMAWLSTHCRTLDEKWLLVEQLRVGQQWKERLTLEGGFHLNLHAKTWPLLARELAGPSLAQHQYTFISRAASEILLQNIVTLLMQRDELKYFTDVRASASLSRLLARSIEDLRLAVIDQLDLPDAVFEAPAKAQDLSRICHEFRQQLAGQRLADYADCLRTAIDGLRAGTIRLPSPLQILCPESFPQSRFELTLLETLIQCGAAWHACPPQDDPANPNNNNNNNNKLAWPRLSIHRGEGAINEIRAVFQRLLHADLPASIPLDKVEVLYTDYQQYVPLVLECLTKWWAQPDAETNDQSLPTLDQLPITFAEGIACIYSRPGRLLRSWLRLSRADFAQAKSVQVVREGLLTKPPAAAPIGYARLASCLRAVPIGFGVQRYLPQLQASLDSAVIDKTLHVAQPSQTPDQPERDFGIPMLSALVSMFQPLVPLAVHPNQDAKAVLCSARELLQHHARAENKLDRYARAKLLDDIDGMLRLLPAGNEHQLDIRSWLEDLPLSSRILASSPKPGCIHIAPLEQGGIIGRPHVFIVGLDDQNYPKTTAVDPILLDAERQRLSADLTTSDAMSQRASSALQRVLARMRGLPEAQVRLSYSDRNLVNDQTNYPSPVLQELLQEMELPAAVTSVSSSDADHLDTIEREMASYLLERSPTVRRDRLESQYEHLRYSRLATAAQQSPEFGPYDGLVPAAGAKQLASILIPTDPAPEPASATSATQPTNHAVSASRLETLGTCPRKYFFQRALGIRAPDLWERETNAWLSPLQLGSLIHELFEDFLLDLTARDLVPNVARDSHPLQSRLDELLRKWAQQIPVHSQDAFDRRRNELMDTCEIFLLKEEEYCQQRQARPWIVEASLGSPRKDRSIQAANPVINQAINPLDCDTPIELALTDGRALRLAGRIDRIDRLLTTGSERYIIWDYKSGSNFGYSQSDPFAQGRKLQPFLYVGMLRHRFEQLNREPDAVEGFGYFFPSPRCEGLRLEWSTIQLSQGEEIIRQLCDLLTSGTFIATNKKEDCGFCDYAPVCGLPEDLVVISEMKAQAPGNPALDAWRSLRHG